MFGFGKISKPALANKIIALSVDASEQFLDYLKEDAFLYSKCINQNPIKNTSTIFMMNIYRDMLNTKYNSDDVFLVIRTATLAMGTNKAMQDLIWQSLMEYMKACREAIDYYRQFPNFDPSDVLTKVYFSLIVDDRDYLQSELDRSIPETVGYKKIYNHINGVNKHRTLLNDRYNLRLR